MRRADASLNVARWKVVRCTPPVNTQRMPARPARQAAASAGERARGPSDFPQDAGTTHHAIVGTTTPRRRRPERRVGEVLRNAERVGLSKGRSGGRAAREVRGGGWQTAGESGLMNDGEKCCRCTPTPVGISVFSHAARRVRERPRGLSSIGTRRMLYGCCRTDAAMFGDAGRRAAPARQTRSANL